jgi:predicted enzyme involved in methoxymalonyl-ACP biosynthesis
MENFTINMIVDLARENGFDKITGEYIPTKKNGIVKDHYADLGFEFKEDKWVLDAATYNNRDTFINKKQL